MIFAASHIDSIKIARWRDGWSFTRGGSRGTRGTGWPGSRSNSIGKLPGRWRWGSAAISGWGCSGPCDLFLMPRPFAIGIHTNFEMRSSRGSAA